MTMAALLRQGARRIGGSVLQRTQAAVTSPAVAEERRRLLVPRRMYGTEEGAREDTASRIQRQKSMLAKWHERQLRFERFDAEFTKFLNGAIVLYSAYAILSCRDFLDKMEAAQTDKK